MYERPRDSAEGKRSGRGDPQSPLEEERKLDFAALCDEAFETLNTYDIRIDEE